MRKSPIAIALSLAMLSTQVLAAESFDQKLSAQGQAEANTKVTQETTGGTAQATGGKDDAGDLDLKELTTMDRLSTQGRRGALTGAIYDDRELDELRHMLTEGDIRRKKTLNERLTIPMQADEIRSLRKKLSSIEKAQNEPLSGMDFRIRNVTYHPESNQPLVILVADGYAAQVEFYDASGQPWSIRKDGVVGDSESFSKKIMGEKRHISSFSLSNRYKQSNAAVILDGLSTSIPVLLKGSDSVVDGRVSVTIPKLGPNAEIQPVFTHEIENVSPELVKLQGGDAPPGSKPLRIAGIDNAEAWYDGKYLYLSLPGRLLLPPPINSSVSPTGRFLYKVSPATYISVSVNGERRAGTIEGLYQAEIRREKTVFDEGVK